MPVARNVRLVCMTFLLLWDKVYSPVFWVTWLSRLGSLEDLGLGGFGLRAEGLGFREFGL